jgi:hypothetical protein
MTTKKTNSKKAAKVIAPKVLIQEKEIQLTTLEPNPTNDSPDAEFETMKHPDPKKHQLVSFIKSGVRILGYMALPFDLTVACFILVGSEVVGILEELV